MTTLPNMLPPFRRALVRRMLLGRALLRAAAVLFLATVVLAGTAATMQRVLDRALGAQRSATNAATAAVADATGGASPDERIRRVNAQLKRLAAVQGEYVKTSVLLTTLAAYVPTDVRLTSVEFDRAKNTFALRGVATTRDALLALQKNLMRAPEYVNVTAPVSNLLERADIAFDVRLQVRPQAP